MTENSNETDSDKVNPFQQYSEEMTPFLLQTAIDYGHFVNMTVDDIVHDPSNFILSCSFDGVDCWTR